MIKNLLLTGTAVAASPVISLAGSDVVTAKEEKLKGNINHSVCQWTYNFLPLDELCRAVKKIGFSAIDLVGPKDWPTLQKNGIFSSMCYTAGENSLTKGWNDPSQHARLIKDFTEAIPLVAKAGYKNVITFSGNRAGMDDETGLKNCVTGLKQIMSLAEKNGVMVQMELLNSKVNHKDYMCDKTPWGVELCKRLGSPNFKLLYDIYHMQIDEGDVIRTIQDNHEYIGHYHTGGVPGRHEIDDSQELYYPAIMKAILATGFKDYVAQEFIPTGKDNGDKIASLKNAIKICDV
ncbi:hydroxypyruvate isomerase family protein [Flavisolibacter ginsenosidimutans]|nr:sugar phosphate isomerase/epimerase family protein [Flavisolibacter ginsenosidimutans]